MRTVVQCLLIIYFTSASKVTYLSGSPNHPEVAQFGSCMFARLLSLILSYRRHLQTCKVPNLWSIIIWGLGLRLVRSRGP